MLFNLFQSVYNLFYYKKPESKLTGTEPYEISTANDINYNEIGEYDKTKKIQLFLQIRHIKNIYYKYTQNICFREQLYNDFLKETDFDYGESAYDDEKYDVRIFDTYICEYIKKRKQFIEELENNGVDFELSYSVESVYKGCMVITFIMDMSDRHILEYCMSVPDNKLMDILLSAIIKDKDKTYTELLR
jgi:hypothetical protein